MSEPTSARGPDPMRPSIDEQKRQSPLYAVLGGLLVAVGGMAGAAVVGAVTFFALQLFAASLSPVASFGVSFVAGAVGFVGVASLYLRRRTADPIEYVGLRWPTLSDVGWVVGGYLAAMALVVAAGIVLTLLQVNPETTNRAAAAGLERPELLLWLVPLSFFVIAPAEELLFRGTVQGRLREAFPAWIAISLTAVIFATLHFFSLTGGAGGRFVAIAILFFPSLVFGTVYERTGNILTSMLIHGAYNSTLALLVYVTLQTVPAQDLSVLL